MLKWAGWLAKLVAAGLIISFLSIWTTGYIVNSYVETLLKQFKLPLETKPFALSGMWGTLWGADPTLKTEKLTAELNEGTGKNSGKSVEEDSGLNSGSSSNSGSNSDTESGSNSGSNSGSKPEPDSDSTKEAAGGKDKAPKETGEDSGNDPLNGSLTDIGGGQGTRAGSGAVREDGKSDAMKDGLAITTEQLNEAKNNMSSEDKEKLFTVMMEKLPQDAWQQISKLLEGGLTSDEMTDVQQIIAQYLNRDEYNQMMEILKKY